jgi:hypothetical protein
MLDNKAQSFVNDLKGFYKHMLKNSLVPFDKSVNQTDFLLQLRSDILSRTYQPSSPREYIIFNKINYVARIVPTFTLRDYCLYFYCIKKLEPILCQDRIEGTFGGWRLPNIIKNIEELETEGMIDYIDVPYLPYSSLSILEWIKNWKAFSKLTFLKTQHFFNGSSCVIIFDIANFYDNIKLDILERKLRLKCEQPSLNRVIDLLLYFLRYWNKPFEGYVPKNVGLPQEETGDCSRLLANFYLQQYDAFMFNICAKYGAEYLRYADDMMIFAHDEAIAKHIMFEASKELHKLGLNINAGKVKILDELEFAEYEAFDILNLLGEPNIADIERAVDLFLLKKQDVNKSFHEERILKRLITLLAKTDVSTIDTEKRETLLKYLLSEENLINSSEWYLTNLLKITSQIGLEHIFLEKLDSLIQLVDFNSFHYQLKHFYDKNKIDYNKHMLEEEINKRKIRVSL